MSVSVELRLLENRYAVAADLEPSATGRDQLDLGVGPLFGELSRQPGGSGLIVSKSAVLYRDLHVVVVSKNRW
jgi:hypothetical protein